MPARLALALFVAVALGIGPVSAADSTWEWPLPSHSVARGYDPPDTQYGPGHRGIDVAGAPGDVVRAVAPGTVRFAGDVAGKGVVVIDHGIEQSTYEPVTPRVSPGDAVVAGQPIGVLRTGHCPGCGAILHLGRKSGTTYLDPLARLSKGRFKLVSPDGPPPVPPTDGGLLALPVAGPVTSPFGWRIHPLTHRRSFHDGIDFGTACGATVHAAAAGTVVLASPVAGYGLRVEVRHDDGSVVSYSHLASAAVHVGESVETGSIAGTVGSSGLSTGCHLHLSVYRGSTAVDPAGLL